MSQRVQLKQDVYMILDGQPQIVLSGSVIDIPNTVNLVAAHAAVLVETPAVVAKPTSVRGVRTR